MTEDRSFEKIRKKAHEINCSLTEEGYNVREIEIVGYYLNRIASSYLSHQTHKELDESEEETHKIKYRL
jgi:hypothetical protein